MAPELIKILLVDDNRADRLVCRQYLQNIPGYTYCIWEEESGEKGILATHSEQFDCLVVDYNLPDMTGLEIIQRCRSQAETAFTPIILLTGLGSESIAVKTLKHGYCDYLLKDHLSPDILHNTIRQNIEKASLQKTIERQYHALEEKNLALETALKELQTIRDELEDRVNQRTRALQNALATLQLQAQVLATMSEGVVVATEGGQIVFTNEALDAMFGYSQGELTGRHTDTLNAKSPEKQASTTAMILKTLHADGRWSGRIMNSRKDGTRFVSYARLNTMQIAGQTYIVGLHEDVTERDALEMKVREQERLANVGTTAVRLTHEIGNRLNGLSTSIQLLERQLHRKQSLDRDMLSETVSDLKGESDRMIVFLQDLRILARAYRLNLLPLDLAPLLRETLRTYEPLCQRNNIAIVEVFPVSFAIVPADRERCSEVLHHLLSNAIEAMPNGGTLTIGLREDDQYIVVSIHDTGRGIPGDVDVFAPFVSTKPGGTGLGLTIAQQLVQAHQGTLGFTSAPNQGTTFILRLPRVVVASQNESSKTFLGERGTSDRVKVQSARGVTMRSTMP